MSDIILEDVKKVLGVPEDYTVFDRDITLYINSVFSTLNQLGVGPDLGFALTDPTATWDTFLGSDLRLNAVKTYMYLRVRMLFDPPTTSFLIAAQEKQILEHEWRLNVQMEETIWVDQDPDPVVEEV